jgi:hypothetical protein
MFKVDMQMINIFMTTHPTHPLIVKFRLFFLFFFCFFEPCINAINSYINDTLSINAHLNMQSKTAAQGPPT